jgi:hypothetical protein
MIKVLECGLNSTHFRQSSVEHGNDIAGSIKGGERCSRWAATSCPKSILLHGLTCSLSATTTNTEQTSITPSETAQRCSKNVCIGSLHKKWSICLGPNLFSIRSKFKSNFFSSKTSHCKKGKIRYRLWTYDLLLWGIFSIWRAFNDARGRIIDNNTQSAICSEISCIKIRFFSQ